MSHSTRRFFSVCIIGAALAVVTGHAAAEEKLVIWFQKGFYPAEDSALNSAVYRFMHKKGVKVELSLFSTQDLVAKTLAALDASSPPDAIFGNALDFQIAGKWAAEGKLDDISDVINSIKDRFLPNTLSTTYLQGPGGKRAYYGVPLFQATLHVHYWKDMLAEAGFKESDIPKDWKGYWSFWCDKVQPAYRQKTGKRIYAIGQPMGIDSTDSVFSFMQFLIAHNVTLVDEDGKLLVDDPKNKAGMVAALKDYTDIAVKDCTPPSSINWKDPDNNVAFHNKSTIMTHNGTISIPAKWLDDISNVADPTGRAQARRNYYENIATVPWPNRPDGKPMPGMVSVKVALVLAAGKNNTRAKEFLRFLVEDENLFPYVEGALGRWYPVTKSGAARDFWTKDKHRKAVADQFRAGTALLPFVHNHKFTILNGENVWAKAMSRVINEKWTPEKAVEEMIGRINQVIS